MRQAKNTFIAAITLVSRAAIKGNVASDEALSLSDLYIQKMELIDNISDIYSLQMNMVIDYTQRVSQIIGTNNKSEFIINLNKYIISHLSDAIKVSDVCSNLYISKSSLFQKLKQITNMTFSEYVINFKINEAKNILIYTDKPVTTISVYLGFSSQSHFNHAFKKITKTTPNKYRQNNRV